MTKDELFNNLNIESLTPMQEAMVQQSANAGGIVLLSPTGSGKTLAFLFPLINLLNADVDALQAVVIVPTRELAVQSHEVLQHMKTGLRAMALYGGRAAMEEHRSMREVRPQVVFATPGRLNDHLRKGNLNAFGTTVLILDEFDKCLELGFQEEMEETLTFFPKVKRTWLISATDAPEIPAFMQAACPSYERIDFLSAEAELQTRISVFAVASPQKDKLETLGRLLTLLKGTPAMIFVSHRESVERIGAWLRQEKFAVVMYHGGMEQEWRERALYKFRSGSANILVSTDLAARGLDIPEVGAVVHYHLPLKAEEYAHRNGRTARWTNNGAIYLLLGPEETVPPYVTTPTEPLPLEHITALRPTNAKYVSLYIGRGKQDKLSKGDVLGFLCKKGGLKSAEIGRIDVGRNHAYAAILRSKHQQVLQQVAGEKIKGMKTLIEVMRK